MTRITHSKLNEIRKIPTLKKELRKYAVLLGEEKRVKDSINSSNLALDNIKNTKKTISEAQSGVGIKTIRDELEKFEKDVFEPHLRKMDKISDDIKAKGNDIDDLNDKKKDAGSKIAKKALEVVGINNEIGKYKKGLSEREDELRNLDEKRVDITNKWNEALNDKEIKIARKKTVQNSIDKLNQQKNDIETEFRFSKINSDDIRKLTGTSVDLKTGIINVSFLNDKNEHAIDISKEMVMVRNQYDLLNLVTLKLAAQKMGIECVDNSKYSGVDERFLIYRKDMILSNIRFSETTMIFFNKDVSIDIFNLLKAPVENGSKSEGFQSIKDISYLFNGKKYDYSNIFNKKTTKNQIEKWVLLSDDIKNETNNTKCYDTLIDDINTEITKIENDLGLAKKDIDNKNLEIDTATKIIKDLNEKLNDKNQAINDIKADQTKIDDQIKDVNKDITNLEKQLKLDDSISQTYEKKIQDYKDDINNFAAKNADTIIKNLEHALDSLNKVAEKLDREGIAYDLTSVDDKIDGKTIATFGIGFDVGKNGKDEIKITDNTKLKGEICANFKTTQDFMFEYSKRVETYMNSKIEELNVKKRQITGRERRVERVMMRAIAKSMNRFAPKNDRVLDIDNQYDYRQRMMAFMYRMNYMLMSFSSSNNNKSFGLGGMF